MEQVVSHIVHTPVGWMKFDGSPTHIQRAGWVAEEEALIGGAAPSAEWKEELEVQLEAYFEKSRYDFHLPLAPEGTDFQEVVWTRISTSRVALEKQDPFSPSLACDHFP